MGNTVTLEWPHEGVALVTVNDAAVPNHNITFATVGALADTLAKAREQGARVSVLASGVPGVWLNHAHLGDLGNLFQGKPASAEPSGWFRAPQELAQTDVDDSAGRAELTKLPSIGIGTSRAVIRAFPANETSEDGSTSRTRYRLCGRLLRRRLCSSAATRGQRPMRRP